MGIRLLNKEPYHKKKAEQLQILEKGINILSVASGFFICWMNLCCFERVWIVKAWGFYQWSSFHILINDDIRAVYYNVSYFIVAGDNIVSF